MNKANVGISDSSNSREAGTEAAREASGSGEFDLFFVFTSVNHDQQQVLEGITEVAGEEATVVGCSDSGEIIGKGELAYAKQVVVMAIDSGQVRIETAVGEGAKQDSFSAGEKTAKSLKEKGEHPSLIVVLTEGLAENGAAIVRGIQEVFGDQMPIMGGAAGDDFAFEKTYQYCQDQVLEGAVVAVALYGEVSFGVGVRHGWEPIGLPMEVTEAEGATLKEIDNKPALSIYEEYFGKESQELVEQPLARMAYTYPLGMKIEGKEEFLIRDVVTANEEGEITAAAEIPEGTEVRLMLGERSKAIQAATRAATEAKQQLAGKTPVAAVVFDCMARNKLLGMDRDKEIQAIEDVIGEEVPLIGFYTYGEIAPLSSEHEQSVWHNETMSFLLFGK